MKFKKLNIFSGICFLISSATILLIPFLDTNSEKNNVTHTIAIIFWIFLLVGIWTQVFLLIRTRKHKIHKNLKTYKLIAVGIAICSLIFMTIAISFFSTNLIALPVILFVFLISIESYSVICRMEKLL